MSSKPFLPGDSYTHVSEAWGSTSRLDRCLCTSDVHECIEDMTMLYGTATADHMPISVMLNVNSLPELANNDSDGKVAWARLTESDLHIRLSEP